MVDMDLWLILIGMGLITFALRAVLIALYGRFQMPELLTRALRYVPPAVLSAIILPELVRRDGQLDISLANARLLAGAVAALVAWRTRNVVLTIAIGMAALWILQLF